MEIIKKNIEKLLENVAIENEKLCLALTDRVELTDYTPNGEIWTSALQCALNEHEVVIIPRGKKPYIIDGPVTIPSNRHIIANEGAVIRLLHGTRVLMMRNENTRDGTHAPITDPRDVNITIEGGLWEDWCPHRLGYGNSGMYDSNRSFFGVSTLMLFNNINNLTLKNMTFKNCGGFAVQLGDISRVIIENIRFDSCFADGIHLNGNAESVHIKNVSGEVGDDLVALNMFDWQNSSINFGPCNNVICEDLTLAQSSHYKALRIEPGIYTYDDGSFVDCSLTNAIIRRVSGIKTFKLYCQTPPYAPGEEPERADVGSGDNIFFEDIKIDLDSPIDNLDEYLDSDPIKGTIAGFELGLNAKSIYLKNIDITLHKDKYPYSYLLCIGPKSARFADGREAFDPYFSSTVENIYLEGITVNGEAPKDISPYVREIAFDKLYDNTPSSGKGKINNIIYK
ncbi:MAG: right-handed parallel beta-helix repeat-containing protein [Ruminococcaceae bacterium]|nr:right-handed parallel beta-helix repeat-containing protein [Oscillospiraceae bacterium]